MSDDGKSFVAGGFQRSRLPLPGKQKPKIGFDPSYSELGQGSFRYEDNKASTREVPLALHVA